MSLGTFMDRASAYVSMALLRVVQVHHWQGQAWGVSLVTPPSFTRPGCKCQFGCLKECFRLLFRSAAQLATLFTLLNLWMVRR